MKTGKEVKIDKYNNYVVKFGCINDKKPKTLYISLSTWIEPKLENIDDYGTILKTMNKEIRQKIYSLLTTNKENIFKDKETILDLDVRESGLKYGKHSFMSCEINLTTNQFNSVLSEKMKKELELVVDYLDEEIFKKNKYFKFNKNKIKKP